MVQKQFATRKCFTTLEVTNTTSRRFGADVRLPTQLLLDFASDLTAGNLVPQTLETTLHSTGTAVLRPLATILFARLLEEPQHHATTFLELRCGFAGVFVGCGRSCNVLYFETVVREMPSWAATDAFVPSAAKSA